MLPGTQEYIERLIRIVQLSPEGVLFVDRRHIVQFVNPAWAYMHGFASASELIETPLETFYTRTQMKQEVYPFLEMVDRIGKYTQQQRHWRKDLGEFIAQTTACLVQDEEGAVVGYVLYASGVEIPNHAHNHGVLPVAAGMEH